MAYCLITFRSITPAQRAENVLHRRGVGCYIQRTPRWMEELGCGYSLRLRRNSTGQALEILKQNGVSYRKVYLQREDGMFEELAL